MPQITEDQRLIVDSARRLFAGTDERARARRAAANWPRLDKTVWSEFASMGWLALLLPEANEGMGGNASDFVVLMEGVADLLPPEPVGPAMAIVPLLAACATKSAICLLQTMLQGEGTALVATDASALLLGGTTHVLPSASWADVIVFGIDEGAGFTLRAIEVDQAGEALSILRTVDGGAMGLALLGPTSGYLLGQGEGVRSAFTRCRNLQRLGAAASLLGIAQASFHQTLDYLKLRRQFGVAIGSFQALQHRAATLHVACQSTRSLVHEATRAIGTPMEDFACAAAKAKATDTAMKIAKESVQLHGAIGFSDESDVALFFRHTVTGAASYGSFDECLRSSFI